MLQQSEKNGVDNSEDFDYKFKIVMLGDPNAGKSSLLSKYVVRINTKKNLSCIITI
jgi:GTPase SAR1 family protein